MSIETNELCKEYFFTKFRKVFQSRKYSELLINKRQVSIREVISGYLENYNIQKRKLDLNGLNMLISYINVLKYRLRNSILKKNNYVEEDFKQILLILGKIEDKKTKNEEKPFLHNRLALSCKSLLRKLNNDNIYKIYIDELKRVDKFDDVDRIFLAIINEITYDGITMSYVSDVFLEELKKIKAENGLDAALDSIKEIKEDEIDFTMYIQLYNLNDFINETLITNKEFSLTKLSRTNPDYTNIVNKFGGRVKVKYNVFKCVVKRRDKYRAILDFFDYIDESYILVDITRPIPRDIYIRKVVIEEESGYKLHENDIKPELALNKSIDKREKKDISDFIEYLKDLGEKGIIDEETNIMRRVLNTIKSIDVHSSEKIFLSQWNGIESILTFYDVNESIIGRITRFIPKLITIYQIKHLINNLWNQAQNHKSNEKVLDFIRSCENEAKDGIDIEKFIQYETGHTEESLKSDFENSKVFLVEIHRVYKVLEDQEYRETYLNKIEQCIKNDLKYIYKTRNMLIHSAEKTNSNIKFKSYRLANYNSRIMGVIIHYKKEEPSLSISEIFNSVVDTYDVYFSKVKSEAPDKKELIKPTYLYIS